MDPTITAVNNPAIHLLKLYLMQSASLLSSRLCRQNIIRKQGVSIGSTQDVKILHEMQRKDQEHLCPWSFKNPFIIYPRSTSVILKYRLGRLAVIFRGACCLVIDMRQDSAGINFIFVSIAVLYRRILGDTSGAVYHIRLITAVSIRNADQRITARAVCLLKFSI